MSQLALTFAGPEPEKPRRLKSIEERFDEWLADNPSVYDEIVALAKRARARGIERYSMKALFEIVRWHRAISTTGDEFKLNNNYTAPMARLVMRREPELADFFEVRESGKGAK